MLLVSSFIAVWSATSDTGNGTAPWPEDKLLTLRKTTMGEGVSFKERAPLPHRARTNPEPRTLITRLIKLPHVNPHFIQLCLLKTMS